MLKSHFDNYDSDDDDIVDGDDGDDEVEQYELRKFSASLKIQISQKVIPP